MSAPSWHPAPADIPTDPGVYRFQDEHNRILYVGKAKNLRQRLSSYFQSSSGMHERTRRMVEQARGVDWTLVPTERQALQLEYLWIKEFQPPFNVRFRDDKSYPYLVVTMSEAVPRVFLARRKNIQGARYFGPFPTAWALRETLSTLLKAFPVRSCSTAVYQKAQRQRRPCLLGDIGKCAAPCVERITPEDHKALAVSLSQFMDGSDTAILGTIRNDMSAAAEALEFERAARLRDRLEAMETILVKNTMVLDDTVDADVFGLASDELVAAAHVFRVRGGRIRSAKGFILDGASSASSEELVEMILRDGFEDYPPAPTIIVPSLPHDPAQWRELLQARRGESGQAGGVSLRVAKRGDLAALAQTVTLNAQHTLSGYLSSRTTDPNARSRALAEIQDLLGLPQAPLRIECFDVSHLGGESAVAAMVVFTDGLPQRQHYRKFALDNPRDDTQAIDQALRRRLARLGENPEGKGPGGFTYPPGLLLIDGGAPQVSTASRVVEDLGLDIPVCGIAKKLEEVWLPGQAFPVIFPRQSEALFLLQRIRDEAHRVAITYQRATRRKTLATDLTSVPGVGPALAASILRVFGSITRVKKASEDELTAVAGVGPALAARIREQLR